MPKKLFLIALSVFFTSFNLCKAQPLQKEITRICIQDCCIQAEVASTLSEREKGLMERKSLSDDTGMLFIFEEEGEHSFWMKNMEFSLDIIWLDSGKKITYIKQNAGPCRDSCESLVPEGKARYALEVPAGFVERNKIEVGQEARF